MAKIHTRTRRKFGINSKTANVNKALKKVTRVRSKTFSTQDLAKAWAEKQKIKKFTIEPAKTNKFQVVVA